MKVERYFIVRSKRGTTAHRLVTKTKRVIEGSNTVCGRRVWKESWLIMLRGRGKVPMCKGCYR